MREGSFILLDIDPEENDSCLLTALDAKKITEILTDSAHEIGNSTKREEYVQQYQETDVGHYQWGSSDGKITVGVAADNASIELSLKGQSPFKMSVNQTVEFIQIFQRFLSD